MSLKNTIKRHKSPFIALVVLSGLFALTLAAMSLTGTFQNNVYLSPGQSTGNPMGLFLFYILALEVLAIAVIIIFFLIISRNN